MKFTAERYDIPIVTGYGPGWIAIDGQRIDRSVLVSSLGAQTPWPCDHFDALGPAHFDTLRDYGVEIIIFGSGRRQRFPRPQWLAALYEARIGLETMSTEAACRTYNILAGEGRKVLLAALIEPAEPAATADIPGRP